MRKKFNTGLAIGKFYPFHNGHRYLIEIAQKNTRKLTVIVCQTDRYKIPAEIRAGWIRDTFPGLDIRILNHSASMDSDSPDISEKWAKLTLKFLGFVPDAVFSSELYGEPYATFMGSKHILVDINRKKIPISATRIRLDLSQYFDYLPGTVQKYFIRKIVVLGAESTGTTTLARDLAAYFQTVWVPEYGRLYYEGRMFSRDASAWSTDEFVHIAQAQNKLEERLLTKANKYLICDTDAFATSLWHERYMGFMSDRVEDTIQESVPSLYILTDIDIPFVQDGTRDGENIRAHMHHRFLEELHTRKINFIVAGGDREKRLSYSVKRIQETLTFLSRE